MKNRPHRAEDRGLQIAGQLVALLAAPEGGLRAGTRHQVVRADLATDSMRVPGRAPLTWTRAQLREQIQRAGAELGPSLKPPGKQPTDADRSPCADREPEP